MKTKKLLSIITTGLIVTSVLAGCSSSSSSSSAASSADASSAPAATTAAAKEVHLKLFLGQGQARLKDQYTKYIDQFKAKELKDKNITVTYEMEMPDANNSDQLLKTRLAAQDEMDIFAIHAGNDIPAYGKAGYLADLSDQPFAAKVLPVIKAAESYEGKVVGVPIENSSWGYIYNKKIFADNGITVPTTLTEMKAVDAKLKAAKITPWLLAYKDTWVPQLVNSLAVGAYVNTTAKDFITNMNKADGSASYKQITGMFDIMDEINANGTAKPLDVNNDAGAADFANGKAAMWLQGPWDSDAILKANKDFQLGVAALPLSDDPNQTLVNLGVSTSLCLSKTSKNPEVAKDLLNYFLDDNDSTGFFQACGFAQVASNQTIKSTPFVEDAQVYVKAGKAYLDPSMPQAVKDEVGKALQGYYLKSLSREAVIKDLDKVWTDSVKNAK